MIGRSLKIFSLFILLIMLLTSCGKISTEKFISHNTNNQALPFISQVLWTSVDSHMPNRSKFIKILREQFQAFGVGLLILKKNEKNQRNPKSKLLFLDIKVKKYANAKDESEHDNILIWNLRSSHKELKTYEMFVPASNVLWQTGDAQPIRLSAVLAFEHFQQELNKNFDIVDLTKDENKLYLNINSNISPANALTFKQGISEQLKSKKINVVSSDSPHDLSLAIYITRIKITNDIDIFHPKSRLRINWRLINDENNELLYSFIQENVILDGYFAKDQWKNLVDIIAKIGIKTVYSHVINGHNENIYNESNKGKNFAQDNSNVKRKKLVIPSFNE